MQLARAGQNGTIFAVHDGADGAAPSRNGGSPFPRATAAARDAGRPYQTIAAPFPRATAAARDAGPPLPDGGLLFHVHLGRADARPSRGIPRISTDPNCVEGARRPTRRWPIFPRAPWPSRRSALPRHPAHFHGQQRRRRFSPPYQTLPLQARKSPAPHDKGRAQGLAFCR